MSNFEKKILKKLANKMKKDLIAREKWELEMYNKYLNQINNNEPRQFDGFLKLIQNA